VGNSLKFVAEIGLNHDGSFDLACELVRQARLAGADFAKFQFGWRDNPGEINHFDREQWVAIKQWCDYVGIEMLASIIREDTLELAEALDLTTYKIASRTVIDQPTLCERILAHGRPTYVSLGMWGGSGFPFGPPGGPLLRYVYCKSKYPTQPADLASMPARFGEDGFFGYSDHSLGIDMCLTAVARGARYVEKHFTLDKTSQVIRDHVLSATPREFRQLVDLGRPMAQFAALGGAAVSRG
jgi:N,N'-diacetyllegionaminate synthase